MKTTANETGAAAKANTVGPAPAWASVVWYWSGGRVAGKWCAADASLTGDLAITKAQIERGGRVTEYGVRAFAPAGPPREERFQALGV